MECITVLITWNVTILSKCWVFFLFFFLKWGLGGANQFHHSSFLTLTTSVKSTPVHYAVSPNRAAAALTCRDSECSWFWKAKGEKTKQKKIQNTSWINDCIFYTRMVNLLHAVLFLSPVTFSHLSNLPEFPRLQHRSVKCLSRFSVDGYIFLFLPFFFFSYKK